MDLTIGNLGDRLSGINCIMDIRSDKSLMKYGFGKVFVNFAETDFFMKKLAKYNDGIKFYESGGSASTLAMTAAIKLGFSKVVLAGVDLAFKDNVIYTTGEVMTRIAQDEIKVDSARKSLVKVRSVNNTPVYTRGDYEAFIHHIAELIKELNYSEVYNITSFGAYIEGVKNVGFDDLNLVASASVRPISDAQPFKLELKDFMQDEFCNINAIISMLSKGVFSTALVSSIVKSVMVYQYMQTEVLNVLQKDFEPDLAQGFIDKTKLAIKTIVELLQKNKLI